MKIILLLVATVVLGFAIHRHDSFLAIQATICYVGFFVMDYTKKIAKEQVHAVAQMSLINIKLITEQNQLLAQTILREKKDIN